MADLPFPVDDAVRRRLVPHVDVEGRLMRTLEALGPVSGRDVLLLDTDGPWRARQLRDAGARLVTAVPGASAATGRPTASADVVVSFWSAFRGGSDAELAEAERVLRPAGRLLVVHEYARDDVSRLWPPARSGELVEWSRRDGWFLRSGFKIRVVHAFWTFPDVPTLHALAAEVSGADAATLLADVRRPRLSWKLVVYHRTRAAERGGEEAAAGT